jgi:formimidoylglutamate deiminase
MLPVLYQRSGFDGGQLEQGQKRFFLGDDEFVDLLLRLNSSWQENLDVTRGIAFHSLRAVDPAKIESVVESAARILGKCPCHIHVSEQQKEVDDCVAALGQTPVELLFESAKIDDRWCLIHATHATPPELALMSKSQSVVGLCPTTEANLGDGFFEAEKFKELGGRMGIGSDSHIAVDPRSELRLIEYAMRLREQRRAILCQDDVSCGQWLYTNFAANGARALGRLTGRIVVGNRADMVVLDNRHPAMFDSDPQTIFDKLVFFELRNPVARVMVGGKWSVNEGRHLLAEESLVAFNRLMKKLVA